MSNSSILYTIGTAINRAHDQDLKVSLLVEGVWIEGMVGAVDGHGVVLGSDTEHSVVRIQSISAVRILAPAPEARASVTAGGHATSPGSNGNAHVMPSTAVSF